jgi:hypothetical protein
MEGRPVVDHRDRAAVEPVETSGHSSLSLGYESASLAGCCGCSKLS